MSRDARRSLSIINLAPFEHCIICTSHRSWLLQLCHSFCGSRMEPHGAVASPCACHKKYDFIFPNGTQTKKTSETPPVAQRCCDMLDDIVQAVALNAVPSLGTWFIRMSFSEVIVILFRNQLVRCANGFINVYERLLVCFISSDKHQRTYLFSWF